MRYTVALALEQVAAVKLLELHVHAPSAHHNLTNCSCLSRPAFIHIYVRRKTAADSASVSCQPSQQQQGEQTLVFEFPRFQGLEFELRGERLHSLDYAGYALRRVQQLVWDSGPAAGTTYTLPGLTKYLVLEHASEEEQAGSSKGKEGQVGSGTGVSGGIPSTSSKPAGQHEAQLVLAPVGDVQRSDGQVVIQHSSSSDAQLEVRRQFGREQIHVAHPVLRRSSSASSCAAQHVPDVLLLTRFAGWWPCCASPELLSNSSLPLEFSPTSCHASKVSGPH